MASPEATTPVPLMPGPWQPLTADESRAFVERLTAVVTRAHGADAFTHYSPITDLRAMPLSFYPGWLLVEGEAVLAAGEIGTFNVLYGPRFMWVIDGESETIHNLNQGRIPALEAAAAGGSADAASAAFLPSPLTSLDESTTGPDYLRFFCASVWGEEGPFFPVESVDDAILQGAEFEDDTWRQCIKPLVMTRVEDKLSAQLCVAYGTTLFSARFSLRQGMLTMDDDELIALTALRKQRYRSPFRDLRQVPAVTSGPEN